MENKKNAVALSDDALDNVSGGLIIDSTGVTNQETGEKYQLLADGLTVFAFVSGLGNVSEGEKIAALKAKGYIA